MVYINASILAEKKQYMSAIRPRNIFIAQDGAGPDGVGDVPGTAAAGAAPSRRVSRRGGMPRGGVVGSLASSRGLEAHFVEDAGAAGGALARPVVSAQRQLRVTNPEAVRTKLEHMQRVGAALQGLGDVTEQRLQTSSVLRSTVERILETGIESMIAICHDLVGDEDIARSAEEVVRACVLDQLAGDYADLVGARNILAHQYEMANVAWLLDKMGKFVLLENFRNAALALSGGAQRDQQPLLRQHAFFQASARGVGSQDLLAEHGDAAAESTEDITPLMELEANSKGDGAAPGAARSPVEQRIDNRLSLMHQLQEDLSSWGVTDAASLNRSFDLRLAVERNLEIQMQIVIDLCADLLERGKVERMSGLKRETIRKCIELIKATLPDNELRGRYVDLVDVRNNFAHEYDSLMCVDIWGVLDRHRYNLRQFYNVVSNCCRMPLVVDRLPAVEAMPGRHPVDRPVGAGATAAQKALSIPAEASPQPQVSDGNVLCKRGWEYSLSELHRNNIAQATIDELKTVYDGIHQTALERIAVVGDEAAMAEEVANNVADGYIKAYLQISRPGKVNDVARRVAEAVVQTQINTYLDARGRVYCSRVAARMALSAADDYVFFFNDILDGVGFEDTDAALANLSKIFDDWYLDGYCEVYKHRDELSVGSATSGMSAVGVYFFAYCRSQRIFVDEGEAQQIAEFLAGIQVEFVSLLSSSRGRIGRREALVLALSIADLFLHCYERAREVGFSVSKFIEMGHTALLLLKYFGKNGKACSLGDELRVNQVYNSINWYFSAVIVYVIMYRNTMSGDQAQADIQALEPTARAIGAITEKIYCEISRYFYGKGAREVAPSDFENFQDGFISFVLDAFFAVRPLTATDLEACSIVSDATHSTFKDYLRLSCERTYDSGEYIAAMNDALPHFVRYYTCFREKGMAHTDADGLSCAVTRYHYEIYEYGQTFFRHLSAQITWEKARLFMDKILAVFSELHLQFPERLPFDDVGFFIVSFREQLKISLKKGSREFKLSFSDCMDVLTDALDIVKRTITLACQAPDVQLGDFFQIANIAYETWRDINLIAVLKGRERPPLRVFADSMALAPVNAYVKSRRDGKPHSIAIEEAGALRERLNPTIAQNLIARPASLRRAT